MTDQWQAIMAKPDPTQIEVDNIVEDNDNLRMELTQSIAINTTLLQQNTQLLKTCSAAITLLCHGKREQALAVLTDNVDFIEPINPAYALMQTPPSAIVRSNPRDD